MDASLRAEFKAATHDRSEELLPYALRTFALDQPLPACAVGRALYHLAQRRGFLTNRKTRRDKNEAGQVSGGISELAERIPKSGCRTLGEYLFRAGVGSVPIRNRWTSREMYDREFENIWRAQEPDHPDLLTTHCKERLHRVLFDQRPLKSRSFQCIQAALPGQPQPLTGQIDRAVSPAPSRAGVIY